MASRWFVGSGTNWSSTTSWSSVGSGGASGAAVPTAADDVKLDALSPGNLIIDLAASCLTIDCTGFTHTLTHNAGITLTIAGQTFKLVAGMTYTATGTSILAFTFATAGTVAITSGGRTLGGMIFASGLTSSSAVYQFQDSSTTATTTTANLTAGTVDLNNFNHSWGLLSTNNSNTRALLLGTGTLTLSGTGTICAINGLGTGLTITPSSSTVVISDTGASTKTFQMGGKLFGNLTITGGGAGSVTITPSTGGAVATFTIGAPKTLLFTASSIFTFTRLVTTSSSGNVITLNSVTSGTQFTLSCGSGVVSSDWLSLKDSKSTGVAFYAGPDSVNTSNNTGWVFAAVPLGTAVPQSVPRAGVR